jgi:hypothetical protein
MLLFWTTFLYQIVADRISSAVSCKLKTKMWSQSYKSFFRVTLSFLPFFAIKFGHFIVNAYVAWWKPSSLRAKNRKRKKQSLVGYLESTLYKCGLKTNTLFLSFFISLTPSFEKKEYSVYFLSVSVLQQQFRR